jgi:hypothetical protein
MSLFLDIGEGAGLAGATGVRPFLPPLLAGVLARGDNGIDFDHSGYRFLESTWFLLLVLAIAVVAYLLERHQPRLIPANLVQRLLFLAAIVLGALLFAGTLAGDGKTSWWGIIAGAVCAALGYAAVATLFARARSRLTGGAQALINVYADALALVIAGVSIAVPPLAFLALAAFLLLMARSRGQGDRKYQGLRILR